MSNASEGASAVEKPTRLQVPMAVEALVVNNSGNGIKYGDVTPNFELILQGLTLGEKLVPADFQTSPNPPPGAHVHWALPDALTHGNQAQGENAPMDYPDLPTRWFVLRSFADVAGQAITLKAWVIESDALWLDSGQTPVGVLEPRLSASLTTGPLSDSLAEALRDLGLPVEADNGIVPHGDGWAVHSGGRRYLISAADDMLIVSVDSSITWPTLDNQDTPYMYLGTATPYEQWSGNPPPVVQVKLNAVGPGDPAFAAFYPSCKSVFGFYDDLADLPNGGTITYTIAGWYADASNNPLAGVTTQEQLVEKLTTLEWCVVGEGSPLVCGELQPIIPVDEAPTFTDVLLHGMVHSVQWQGPTADYTSGVPTGDPEISVGNTYIESLSALIATKIPGDDNVDELLEAFQYGLLSHIDQPDGEKALALALHQAAFRTKPGGVWWEVKRVPDNDPDPDTPPDTLPFPGNVGPLLSKLIALQEQFESESEALAAYQWELYSTWYKRILLVFSPNSMGQLQESSEILREAFRAVPGNIMEHGFQVEPRDGRTQVVLSDGSSITIAQVNELLTRMEAKVVTMKDALGPIQTDLTAAEENLKAEIAAVLPGYELTHVTRPRYWAPNEPVLLFSGDGVQRAFKHGFDTQLAEEGSAMPCRMPGATITGLSVAPEGHPLQTVTVTQLEALYGTFPAGQPIPAGIIPLSTESLLLDTSEAALIALEAWKLAGVEAPTKAQLDALATTVESIQNKPWAALLVPSVSTRDLAAAAGLDGTLPYKISVASWVQPWTPLYLEWDVSWNSSYAEPGDGLGDKWIFGDAEYSWNTKYPPDENPPARFLGRTILAPSPALDLQQRLQQYLEAHKCDRNYQTLLDISGQLGDLDLLAQAMSGFNEALTMRSLSLQLPVIDLSDPNIGQQVAAAIDKHNDVAPQPVYSYEPIRAGHFVVARLWIVDAFAQVKELVGSSRAFNPIRARTVTTPGDYPTLVQLPPRFAQHTRLEFRFLMASDDTRQSNSDPATNPICGWLLPNHLDNSLMIYDGGGHPKGELQLLSDAAAAVGTGVRWMAAPGTYSAVGLPPQLDNVHLQGFVEGILNLGSSGKNALQSFLSVIDETLGTINPLGSRRGDNLSVLVGRPLALVRASLKLTLLGGPDYDQSWDALMTFYNTGKFVTEGFDAVKLPIRLGDVQRTQDGTLGYFLGDDYGQFFSTLAALPKGDDAQTYVEFGIPIPLASDPDLDAQMLTLLVDPRLGTHATSDILPTKEISVPPHYVSDALQNMDITFRIGPLLSDRDTLQVPLPGNVSGIWSWVFQPDVTGWEEDTDLSTVDSKAQLAGKPKHINEGWLKIKDAFLETKLQPPDGIEKP